MENNEAREGQRARDEAEIPETDVDDEPERGSEPAREQPGYISGGGQPGYISGGGEPDYISGGGEPNDEPGT